ncbi:hypothetical protein CC1G_03181 [Coprinopsis cinerea okayama7|uniref:P-loop containing nucleoside triphosphate hydrolase protein n=1 Tax=Coprinopsis cinerea (strain Okayama-7 / 130 / ATCC MYA-4618 / FGSC 9003) TaxID=240176 RepID=A8PF80_COPC7|nr:hypothetical protein CC1G_03181 [Coprinopsis cinerea okayama7\|eukprot:XP_001840952.1 hypothetical protein CC1G_03181 [Coprinopsis cinerea okayama7\
MGDVAAAAPSPTEVDESTTSTPTSGTRQDTKIIATRAYQQEMLDESLRRNIIIALDTGSGKTHIAVLRIKHELERENRKICWFLAPTVALCQQQQSVIKTYIPGPVGLISGAHQPDQWKNAALWKSVLETHRVIVSTPQVFLDALRHGYINMGLQIGLLVFDEAHHAADKHPYNLIMKDFYFKLPARSPMHDADFPCRPMVLGLTASPIFGSGDVNKAFRLIEAHLDAMICTPRYNRKELAQHVHRPIFKHAPYMSCPTQSFSTNLATLSSVLEGLDIQNDPNVLSLRSQLSKTPPDSPEWRRLDQRLSKTITKQDSFTHKGLADFHRAASDICFSIGAWAADWYVWTVVQKAKHAANPYNNIMSTWRSSEKAYLLQILTSLVLSPPSYYEDDILSECTDKVRVLVECLLEEKEEVEGLNESFSGIVFVQRRDAVLALAELLKHHPFTKDSFTVGVLLGTSDSAHRHSLMDVTRHITKQSQDSTLSSFRLGIHNLILATSVAEEGLDIPACGSVIRWDPPPNMASWIQSRGRARRKRSTFTLMYDVEEDRAQANVAKWREVEERMVEMYSRNSGGREGDAGVDVEDWEGEEPDDFDAVLSVESTGAYLTPHSAVSHLAHFCAVISRSGSNENRPIYDIDPPDYVPGLHLTAPSAAGSQSTGFASSMAHAHQPYAGPWTSTVTLPRSLPLPTRSFTTAKPYATKLAAHRHAAFLAYSYLHEVGLLNEHLLPLYEDGRWSEEEEEEVRRMLEDVEKRVGLVSGGSGGVQVDPWVEERGYEGRGGGRLGRSVGVLDVEVDGGAPTLDARTKSSAADDDDDTDARMTIEQQPASNDSASASASNDDNEVEELEVWYTSVLQFSHAPPLYMFTRVRVPEVDFEEGPVLYRPGREEVRVGVYRVDGSNEGVPERAVVRRTRTRTREGAEMEEAKGGEEAKEKGKERKEEAEKNKAPVVTSPWSTAGLVSSTAASLPKSRSTSSVSSSSSWYTAASNTDDSSGWDTVSVDPAASHAGISAGSSSWDTPTASKVDPTWWSDSAAAPGADPSWFTATNSTPSTVNDNGDHTSSSANPMFSSTRDLTSTFTANQTRDTSSTAHEDQIPREESLKAHEGNLKAHEDLIAHAKSYTRMLFWCLNGSRMEWSNTDFAYLFLPVGFGKFVGVWEERRGWGLGASAAASAGMEEGFNADAGGGGAGAGAGGRYSQSQGSASNSVFIPESAYPSFRPESAYTSPALSFLHRYGPVDDITIVKKSLHYGRPYSFVRWQWERVGEEEEERIREFYRGKSKRKVDGGGRREVDGEEDEEVEVVYPLLVVKPFPPRTNFLVPVSEGKAKRKGSKDDMNERGKDDVSEGGKDDANERGKDDDNHNEKGKEKGKEPPKELYLLPQHTSIALFSPDEVEYAVLLPSVLRFLGVRLTVMGLRDGLFGSASALDSLAPSLSSDSSISSGSDVSTAIHASSSGGFTSSTSTPSNSTSSNLASTSTSTPTTLTQIPLDVLTVALTAPVAGERHNYQRLETLGDTVLKFLAGIQIFAEYPMWHEGYLTKRKDHAVANVRLAKECVKRGVVRWIIRDRLLGKKWKPRYITKADPSRGEPMDVDPIPDVVKRDKPKDTGAKEIGAKETSVSDAEMKVDKGEESNAEAKIDDDGKGLKAETKVQGEKKKKKKNKQANKQLSTKVLADVIESLIGAAYISGGFPLGYECAKFFDLGLKWAPLPTRVDQILSRVQPEDDIPIPPQLADVEHMLGYTFKRKILLIEALTHASYREHINTISYERMEFIGDSILDMVVTDMLYRAPREYSPGHIHLRRSAVVNGHFLAYICLGMWRELEGVMPQPSASSNAGKDDWNPYLNPPTFEEGTTAHRIHLSQCLLHSSQQVLDDLRNTVERYELRREEIADALEHGSIFPWSSLTRLQAPKFLSDIVESTIGAAFIDSGFSIPVVTSIIRRIGILPVLERIIRDDVDVLHPVSRLSMWAAQNERKVEYKYEKKRGDVACTVVVDGVEEVREVEKYRGVSSEVEVRFAAAERAIKEFKLRVGGGRGKTKAKASANEGDVDVEMKDGEKKEEMVVDRKGKGRAIK